MNDTDTSVALSDFTRIVSPAPDSGDAAAGEADASVASQHPSELSSKSEPDDPDLDTEVDSEGPSEKEEDAGSEEEDDGEEEGDEEEGDEEEGRRGAGGKVHVRRRRRVREQQQEEGEKEEEEEEIPST